MYPYFFYNTSMLIPFLAAFLFSIYAQWKVKSTFGKYSAVPNNYGITGAMAARRVLDYNGLQNVTIERVSGSLTDHYDPKSNILRLSDSVYNSTSVAAISVACHEVGHAIQDAKNYVPLRTRNAIVPVVNFANSLFFPIAMLGFYVLYSRQSLFGDTLINISIILFSVVFLFHLVTLPVEIDASRRALKEMENVGLVYGEEVNQSRKVLTAAAMTYLAALAMALVQLLRLLAMRRSSD